MFFLVFYLFTQAWANISYDPQVLDQFPACAASTSTSVIIPGVKTSTATSWVPVATFEQVPEPHCLSHDPKSTNDYTMMAAIKGSYGGLPQDGFWDTSLPCGGPTPPGIKNPVIFMIANSSCHLLTAWISPVNSEWPRGNAKDAETTPYKGALWGLESSYLKYIISIWWIGYPYSPDIEATYGDGLYKAIIDDPKNFQWSEPVEDAPAGINWHNMFFRRAFPWDGINANERGAKPPN